MVTDKNVVVGAAVGTAAAYVTVTIVVGVGRCIVGMWRNRAHAQAAPAPAQAAPAAAQETTPPVQTV